MHHKQLPRWPLRFLKKICSEEQLEVLYGDMLEIFEGRIESIGYWRALFLFFRDAFSLLRPFAMKKRAKFHMSSHLALLDNYLTITFRGFTRNKLSSAINFFGLSVGFFAVLVLAQHILFEMSYDKFHPHADQLYRVSYQRSEQSQLTFNGATTFLPIGPMIEEEYADVSAHCRLYYSFTHGVFTIEDEAFHEEKPVFADDSFFDLFGFELLRGDPSNALAAPNGVVMSERLAAKYFGSADPLGQVLRFTFEDGTAELIVRGIMANPRPDSHLQLEVLISFSTLNQWPIFQGNDWRFPFYHTYVRLQPGTTASQLEAGFNTQLGQYRPTDEGQDERIVLQRVTDIHLDSHLTFELGQNGDREVIQLLVVVAALILIIVYLNYVNLATALSTLKGKEVGVRKVMGSRGGQIVSRFVLEAVLINGLAFLMALGSLWLLRGVLGDLLQFDLVVTDDRAFWVLAVVGVLLGAVVSSLYPALMSAAFRPLSIFQGRLSMKAQGGALRKVLIGAQFAISVAMIGGVILISLQTSFLLNKDLGFDANEMLVISAPPVSDNRPDIFESFGDEVLTNLQIEAFTASNSVPGRVMSAGSIQRMDQTTAEPAPVHFMTVDPAYFETYGVKVTHGRGFSRSFQSDDLMVVINEAAVEALGFGSAEEALGARLSVGGRLEFKVLGVINDYHHSSLKTGYEPIVFSLNFGKPIYLSFRVSTENLPETLASIKSVLKAHFPSAPFEYFFLDQVFDQEFKVEMQYGSVLKVFSALAILLAGLGLFGLASFLLIARMKEIGIRKVLGATSRDFWTLLGGHFTIPLVVGCAIAFAALYVLGNRWLESFPFRTDWQAIVFVVPFAAVVFLATVTLGAMTWRTLRVDPAKILKDE